MKKLLVMSAVISLTAGVASAQKVHSGNQDIRFSAGVRIPIENTSAMESEVMTLTYGRYFHKGLGFRTGVQWMFENYDINDYLGVPLYFSWCSDKRTFKESVKQGVENAAWGAYHDKAYYNSDPDVQSALGSFILGLFNRFEFFAGLTPGYVFGHREDFHGDSREVSYMRLNTRFSLSADAGLGLSFRIWRFELSAIPSVHYFITDNYRDMYVRRYTHDGSTDVFTSDKAKSWQFSIQGGLSFTF